MKLETQLYKTWIRHQHHRQEMSQFDDFVFFLFRELTIE